LANNSEDVIKFMVKELLAFSNECIPVS